MNFETTTLPPYRVARDTYVISELFPAGPDAFVPVNSAVITGAEPVLIDTGTALNRNSWFDAVGSVVDIADVRWVFLSHDDHDHVGNLAKVLEMAPKATLVTTWFSLERLAGDIRVPLERVRWVRNRESFDVGDRTLVTLRPPIFDAPTTRGLYDATTGVYWAGDSFASLVPGPVTDAASIPTAMWEETFLFLNRLVSPWHTLVDPSRFAATVDAVAALDPTVVIAGHAAATSGSVLQRAYDLLRQLPTLEGAVEPSQLDLEAMLAMIPAA